MNLMDYVLLAILVIAIVAVILYMRKHKGGCGDCKGCTSKCHQPDVYASYRKDHPKFEEEK